MEGPSAAETLKSSLTLNPFSVNESAMELMKEDNIRVCRAEDISTPQLVSGSGEKTFGSLQMYTVAGASSSELNGRYLEWGIAAGAKRYRNVRGWVLFRVSLSEIPEV